MRLESSATSVPDRRAPDYGNRCEAPHFLDAGRNPLPELIAAEPVLVAEQNRGAPRVAPAVLRGVLLDGGQAVLPADVDVDLIAPAEQVAHADTRHGSHIEPVEVVADVCRRVEGDGRRDRHEALAVVVVDRTRSRGLLLALQEIPDVRPGFREQTPAGAQGPFVLRQDGNLQVVELASVGEVRVVAVSYTHLRAHETVLDLVCRLLLEKTKNK